MKFVVNSPLNKSHLTFRGSVNGEEPPVRVIQGRRRDIRSRYRRSQYGDGGSEHNEIFLPVATASGAAALVAFKGLRIIDRLADGDVAPKRVLAARIR